MHYLWQHIKAVISTYDGSVPLTHFLKNYCKRFPVLGSRDRKMISTIVYSWYRCSRAINDAHKNQENFENAVKICLEMCGVEMEAYARLFATVKPLPSVPKTDIERLFSSWIMLSPGIKREEWLKSMLQKPQLFIRVLKDKEKIEALLDEKGISYKYISDSCISMPNGTAVDKLLPAAAYVVQDASSQQTGDFFTPVAGQRWYDCCAGAGGKSLLLMGKGVPVKLTVTDKRASIIHNLKERFRSYGYPLPVAYVADASTNRQLGSILMDTYFDSIICDAPCSGSGTWARTPEQMYFFDEQALDRFSTLQLDIATNVSQYLKKGGTLIYITCSVFRQENEEVTEAIVKSCGLRLKEQRLINGTGIGADSMFVAVLEKPE